MYLFSLIYGLIAALIALVLQIVLNNIAPFTILSPLETAPLAATIAILFLAFTEEATKAIAVIKGMRVPPIPHRAFLHAFFVGVGFTIVEFALIALQPYDTNPFSSPAVLGDIIIHACSPILIAALFIILRNWHWAARNASTLLIVTLLHASYNILAYTGYSASSWPQILFLGTFVIATLYAIVSTIYTHLNNSQKERL